MLLIGIDFESTGLDIKTIGVTEIGMVVWDTDLHAPIRLFGSLVDPGTKAIWEPGVEKINNLTPELCAKYGMNDEKACRYVLSWYGDADIAVGHNGNEFDKPLLDEWASRYGLDSQKSKLWLDTKVDLPLDERTSTRLTYMAADHGFLNPFSHRAMTDVLTMFKIMDHYDINAVIESAKTPNVIVQALVSYDNRELAKRRGYHWQPENKTWTRQLKANKVAEEEAAAGFAIKIIN